MIVPCVLLQVLQFVFLTRLVLSFFPLSPTSLVGRYRDMSVAVTEPLVSPIRKAMPPVSGPLRNFGLAELVFLVILYVLIAIVCGVAVG